MKTDYSPEEISQEMSMLSNTFTRVRLVDPIQRTEVEFDGEHPVARCDCYDVWRNGAACFNCVSAQAVIKQDVETKIEFCGKDPFVVTSKYIKVGGHPLALEIVAPMKMDSMVTASGLSKYLEIITKYNDAIYRDFLTGAYNRRFLNEKLPVFMRQSEGGGLPIGFVYYDVDRLKTINDSCGHDVGDKLLSAVTHLVAHYISDRRGDFVCRLGGDEFLVVFNGIKHSVFKTRLKEISSSVKDHDFSDIIKNGDHGRNITISIGGVTSDELPAGSDIDAFLSKADERLYKVKDICRGGIVSE